jgi:integrase
MARKPHFGSLRLRGKIWWIRYYRDGQRFEESSESEKVTVAEKLLNQRHAEIYAGTHVDPRAGRILVGGLLDDLVTDYRVNDKSEYWASLVVRVHLKPFFGGMQVSRANKVAALRYIDERREAGASNGTINREMALLGRAFRLAREHGKIKIVPTLPKKLTENAPRKGFFEHQDFVAIRDALPEEMKAPVTFAYWTGCRKGEILSLQWSQVDLGNRTARLEAGETKNKEPRILPLVKELHAVLSTQKHLRDDSWPSCPWVFFRRGEQIRRFDRAWEKACKAVGLWDAELKKPTKLFHDLRRTGVRNLVRAGVPEQVAMAISGHKTRAVFDRYNIVSEQDLHEAGRKLDAYIARTWGQNGDNREKRPKKGARKLPVSV